jgi:hypothetical protein
MKLDAHASATVLPPLILARKAQFWKASAPTTAGEDGSPPGEELPHLVATRQELTEVPPGRGTGVQWRMPSGEQSMRRAALHASRASKHVETTFQGRTVRPQGWKFLP